MFQMYCTSVYIKTVSSYCTNVHVKKVSSYCTSVHVNTVSSYCSSVHVKTVSSYFTSNVRNSRARIAICYSKLSRLLLKIELG